jgi:sugar (pentulose or hexulose) kinase
MAAKGLFLGIDVSTTGAKALLIDEQGAVVARYGRSKIRTSGGTARLPASAVRWQRPARLAPMCALSA